MRIALITNFSPATGGGKYSFELFKNMEKKGIDLIYCNSKKTKMDFLENERIKQIRGINFPFYKETLNWYFYYPKKIPSGYSLYHVTNQFLSNVCNFRKPSIITVLDLVLLKSNKYAPILTNHLQRKALKNINNAEKIISISEDTKKDIVDILKIDENKIKVIHVGIDHELFKYRKKLECRETLDIPKNKKIILHVGSDDPRRNVKTILESFHEIQKHNDCILIKIGKLSNQSVKIANKLNLNKKILVFDRVPEQNLPLFYSSCDIFLCLDIETGFGMPTLEAMACGKSVVCSKGGAFPEVVGSGGFLVNPENKKEIVSALDCLLTDEQLEKKISKKALKLSWNFSWKKCAKETIKVYESVLK